MTVIQLPGVQWVVSLLQLKLGYACDIFTPRVQPQEKMYSSWELITNTIPIKDRVTALYHQ
jgi:hypothetical protein